MFISWSGEKPKIKEKLIGALREENKAELKRLCSELSKDDIILELGAYYGLSTRFLAEHSKAKIITVDHFLGSKEHNERPYLKPLIPAMFQTFLVNLWDYQDRIQIFKGTTWQFFSGINRKLNIKLIYIDASHETPDVLADLTSAYDIFPYAKICGDDWGWSSVREAIFMFLDKTRNCTISINGNFWELIR